MPASSPIRVVLVIHGSKADAIMACFDHSVILESMSAGTGGSDQIVTGHISMRDLDDWWTLSHIRSRLDLPAKPGDLSWYSYRRAASA